MSRPPDYKFFDDFDTYYIIDHEADTIVKTEPKTIFCNNLKIEPNMNSQIINICKKFVKLYEYVNSDYSARGKVPSNLNKYYDFMNYWLYNKLNDAGYDEERIKKFFEELTKNSSSFASDIIPMDKICVLDIKYFNNMNTLYQLYKNCEKLKDEKLEYDKFFSELKEKYNDGLLKCFNKADNNFCIALKTFRDNYNIDKMKVSNHCKDQKCPSLPEIELEHSSSDKASVIAKIGSVLIGTSNAQPRNGLSLISSEVYSNLKDLISLQYNLRMEKDEDEKKSVMQKILYEYLKYSNEHNDNWYLESFINEFIEKYYNKKEIDYKQLFKKCASGEDRNKEYCTYYNRCKSEFEKDFKLIENNKNDYTKYKEEHFKNLNSNKSWVQKALDLFKDSATILRNSPTITSTLIGIFLCFFFLYKLTPLNSRFRKDKKRRKIPLFYPQRIIQDVKVDNSGYNNPPKKREKIRFAYQPS